MADGGSLKFSFLCGLRGYHEYHTIWSPTIGEELVAKHESHSVQDRYAIAALKLLPGTIHPSVVGHLPRKISRFTYYIIIHGGRVSCQVISVRYRRSPLVQGGLEIPVRVIIDMDIADSNTQVLKKYEELVVVYYKEPENGTFNDVTASVFAALSGDEEDDNSDSESGPESELY
jgi:hypothetical protein